jgi:hypothetical protein
MSSIVIDVHLTITVENLHDDLVERAKQISERICAEESKRVRILFERDMAEEFGAGFLGDQADA